MVTVNPVALNDVATTTINVVATATGPAGATPHHHHRPLRYIGDLRRGGVAITGTHRPFAVTPSRPASVPTRCPRSSGYRKQPPMLLEGPVLSVDQYQAPYDRQVATDRAATRPGTPTGVPARRTPSPPRTMESSVVLAPYVPGTGPGQFRGLRTRSTASPPAVKPFSMLSSSQSPGAGTADAR